MICRVWLGITYCLLLQVSAPTDIYTLSLHDALPICSGFRTRVRNSASRVLRSCRCSPWSPLRSEEHTSELQSRLHLVCRLLLEKKNMCDEVAQAALTYTSCLLHLPALV